jgi:hypothetical protein
MFEWIARTETAVFIKQSPHLVGLLSSLHLLALTVIGGSAVVACLRFSGFLLPGRPPSEVARPAWNGIVCGFVLAFASGILLFAPRASTAPSDPAFQVKMVLVLAAVVFHCTLFHRVAWSDQSRPALLFVTGIAGLTLWLGVAFAGFAFAVFN